MSTNTEGARAIEHATESTFAQIVLESNVPVLVDFYADWCRPCQMLAPSLEKVARESSNAKVVKVNIDDNPGLAQRYGVSSIPNLKVFHGGQVVAEHEGLASEGRMRALLNM